MTSATLLLKLALALLIAAQMPNVSPSLKATAINTANQAIVVAMAAEQPPEAPQSLVQGQTNPVVVAANPYITYQGITPYDKQWFPDNAPPTTSFPMNSGYEN